MAQQAAANYFVFDLKSVAENNLEESKSQAENLYSSNGSKEESIGNYLKSKQGGLNLLDRSSVVSNEIDMKS